MRRHAGFPIFARTGALSAAASGYPFCESTSLSINTAVAVSVCVCNVFGGVENALRRTPLVEVDNVAGLGSLWLGEEIGPRLHDPESLLQTITTPIRMHRRITDLVGKA